MSYRLPIGEDDFEKVRKNYYFVDKTPFIREFLDHHATVTLFTRPRRFGKTLTLSMLRYFFDIEHAEEHRNLFDGLAIASDAEAMKEQGTRPVLFLTLKDWKANSWAELQEIIKERLGSYFSTQSFLLDDPAILERDRIVFQEIQMGRADLAYYRTALSFLMKLMEQHYGKPPILLLDEYDTPIQSGWEHNYYSASIDFFRGFLSTALKTNLSVEFAILTGVLRISKESIFSDLNNLHVDSILSSRYPEAFGFTPTDVEHMAKDFDRTDKLPEIQSWYDGYRFEGKEIYNPWSVLNYFYMDCEPDTYWVNTSGNSILQKMLQHAEEETWERLQGLLQGKPIRATVREGFIYSEIYKNKNALYTMLLTTGYLTCQRVRRTDLGKKAELILPNRELLSLFRIEILERFHTDELPMDIEDLMQALLDGDVALAQRGLSRYLEILASTFDTGEKEAFYHGFVLGLTAVLVPAYEVQSNREAGYGRFDVAVFPKDVEATGMVFEFKTAEEEAGLDKKADEALAQIEERDYLASFRARGIHSVRRYGAAFCGKRVWLKLAEETKIA